MPPPARHLRSSYRHIWQLSWPVMLSNISLPLVGAVDVAMMGHLNDPAYIGGVGLGMLVFNLLYFGFGFLRMGTTGFTARARGEGNMPEVTSLLIRGLMLAILCSTALIILHPILIWLAANMLDASPAVEGHMAHYISIRIWAIPAALCNIALLGWLFGMQSMRMGMVQLFIINLSNIGLNILFVTSLELGVTGVALASVLAQWAGLIIMLYFVFLRRRHYQLTSFQLSPRALFTHPSWRAFMTVSRDLCLRTVMIWAVEAILLGHAAKTGDLSLASMQIVLVIFGFIAFGLDGFAYATEALVGDRLGKRDFADMKYIIWRSTLLAFYSSVLLSAVLFFCRLPILSMLTSQPDLIEATTAIWIYVSVIPLVSFLAFQMDGVFVGATNSAEMRNGMAFALISFIAAHYLFSFADLDAALTAFIFYLGARGVYLAARLPVLFTNR